MITFYTDGSAIDNPGKGGWGVIVLEDGKKLTEFAGCAANTTNNRMELQAVIEGLLWYAKQQGVDIQGFQQKTQGIGLFGSNASGSIDETIKDPISIYTDSNYVKLGITQWIQTWIERDWKLSKGGKKVKNVDLWQRLHDLTRIFSNITWKWVKAHNGNKWNERVDDLARDAAFKAQN